jgi:pimeloyl-ACP methyl ester carboxylesterase
MGAAGFGTLATHFTDRTIVTCDPRGVERSERTDPDLEVTPDAHAGDVRAVIDAIGGGPVDVFASSGGAVHDTYQRHGWGHGMAHFVALVSLRGPVPADFASQAAPIRRCSACRRRMMAPATT